ncbi:NUDIX hydrolase [Candidatus Saccharibacteria bacterium]|nr:NUDIX hydrolase [Candidatus Saccharibacteria bacterium]
MIVEHHIQRQILRELVKGEAKRFSEIKPKAVESNLFMYHLRQLIRGGLVAKDNESSKYTLTKEGRLYADRSNLPTMKLRLQPKQITVLVVRNKKGQYILLKRTHVPYFDFVGFPSGKIHYGEKLEESATRELKEKSGIEDVKLKLGGNILMRFYDESGELVSHVNAYVFSGESGLEELVFENEFFESYLGEADQLYTEKTFKGHKEIIELISQSNGEIFVKEFDFVSDF